MQDINQEMKALIYCLLKTYTNNDFQVTEDLLRKIPKDFDIVAHKNYEQLTIQYEIKEYLR